MFLEPFSQKHFITFITNKKGSWKNILKNITVVFPYVPTNRVTIGKRIHTWVSLAILWIMHGLSKKEFLHFEFLMMHTLLRIFTDSLELFLKSIKLKTKFLQLVLISTADIPALIDLYKPYLGGKFFHQRCACHVLNLYVQKGLETLEQFIHPIKKALMHLWKHSPTMKAWAKYCK